MISTILFIVSCAIAACSGDISAGAPPGFVPYHAGIYDKTPQILDPNTTVYTFMCSGAIISTDTVLTTATCIENKMFESVGFAVLVGFVDRFDADVVYVDVAEVRKHDAYVEGDKTNDIAVLKLGVGVTLSENVKTIGIRETAAVGIGTACTLSGWRKDMVTISPVLRYSNVSILEETKCQDKVEAEICAGAATEEDAVGCQLGDEGSPVSCEFFLTGLMHYSTSTCLADPEPGVFADVFYHAAWIKTQIAAESLSSTSSSATSETSTVVSSSTLTSTASTMVSSSSSEATTSTETTATSATASTMVSSSTSETATSTASTVEESTTSEASISTETSETSTTASTTVSSSSTEASTPTETTATSATASTMVSSSTSETATSTASTVEESTTSEASISTETSETSTTASTMVSSSSSDATTSTEIPATSSTGSTVEASSTSEASTSTEAVASTSTPMPAPTYDPDHPTGELLGGTGSLASSVVAVIVLAVAVVLVQ